MSTRAESFIGQSRWLWRTVNKRRRLALGIASLVMIASALGITNVPDRYEARARIYVDTQTALKPLMTGLALQPDIDEQVRMLARNLLSRPNVERLIRTPSLRDDAFDIGSDDVVTRLMGQIKVEPTTVGNLYEITYRGATPQRARRLVEATVNLFAHADMGTKIRDSQDAGRFIEEQIRDYEAKLVDAEDRRKEFKQRTFSASGGSTHDYFVRVASLSDEVGKLKTDLVSTERLRDAYRTDLASEDPQLPADNGVRPRSGGAGDLVTRHKELDELRLKFTDKHPDVIAARRIVDQLESEASERRAEQQRAWSAAGKPGIAVTAPTSPVYQRLRISLADAEAHLAALRAQLVDQEARLSEARALAVRAPQVEAELAQLNRDYDVIRKNYEVMVARRESASLGMKLDESAQLAEFRVIDPPSVSRFPAFPGRWHLALIAVVMSLTAGAAAALIAENAWPTIDESPMLRRLSNRPVLGIVPLYRDTDEQRAHTRSGFFDAGACVALLLIQGLWVGWYVIQMYPEWSIS